MLWQIAQVKAPDIVEEIRPKKNRKNTELERLPEIVSELKIVI
jgi:hypothetical protein